MASNIVQTGIGLERSTLLRCDRLRACYGRSRSWVIERGLQVGLAKLEAEKADEVQLFSRLAERHGMTWQQYVAWYVGEYGLKTFPPTVTDLDNWSESGRGAGKGALGRKLGRSEQQAAQQALDIMQAGQRKVAEAHPVPAAPRGLRDLT
jgi:hypothetical protein